MSPVSQYPVTCLQYCCLPLTNCSCCYSLLLHPVFVTLPLQPYAYPPHPKIYSLPNTLYLTLFKVVLKAHPIQSCKIYPSIIQSYSIFKEFHFSIFNSNFRDCCCNAWRRFDSMLLGPCFLSLWLLLSPVCLN